MKIKKEHYEILKASIEKLGVEKIKEHREAIKNSGKYKDLNKRLRWDCLYATKIKIGDGIGLSGLPLYAYLNGDHIDTALKRIMSELQIC